MKQQNLIFVKKKQDLKNGLEESIAKDILAMAIYKI